MPTTFERYAADAGLVLGGAAAILLQVADPVVGAAVARHSGFAKDPMRRLRATLGYVYAVALADDEVQRMVAGQVDRAHSGIPGARDADRQLWVAATLYRVGTATWTTLHGPLEPAAADEVYARSARLGTLLQLPPDAWPADRAAFDAYWERAVAGLRVTAEARAVARDLLHARRVPLWVRLALPFARAVTPAFLPDELARAYGLRVGGSRTAIAVARVLLRITPRRLRELPSRRLLAGLRAEAARAGASPDGAGPDGAGSP